MALQKVIEDPGTGAAGSYHKVLRTEVDWHNQIFDMVLGSFLTEETRNLGKAPLFIERYRWTSETFGFEYEDNIVQRCYLRLKTMDKWIGALDV